MTSLRPHLLSMAFPLRYAVRRLANAPGFTLVSVAMLTLGIAMSTSAFSITSSALLRPLPFHAPDELVRVFTTSPRSASWPLAPGNALDVLDALATTGEFALFSIEQQNIGLPGRSPEQHAALSASPDLLRVLGVQPALGRDFLPDDALPGKPPVVLLGYRYWREHFGASPTALGATVRIDGTDCIVVGVLRPKFDDALLWYGCACVTPLTVSPSWHSRRSPRWLHVLGRLHEDVSRGEVQARLDALAARLARDYPIEIGRTGLRVTALGPSYATPSVRTTYWLVVALSIAVLLIACANLGGVQLARALARRRELAVRVALGATQCDLLATLAAESVVLSVLGTTAGLGLTYWTQAAISHWLGGPPITIDVRVFAFALLAGGLVVIAFGVLPGYLGARGAIGDAVKDASRAATPGSSHQRLKRWLVVGQFALAFVLISAAASFVLGIRMFLTRDRGWQPVGLVAGEITLPSRLAQSEKANPRFGVRLQHELQQIPGVDSVATASTVPLYGYQHPGPLVAEGAETRPGQEPMAYITSVDPTFFSVLGIRLVEGRLFPSEWRPTDPTVAVVSASTAHRLFPDQSALGKRIRFAPEAAWHEIVGVVADASMAVGFDVPVASLQVYRPLQEPFGPMYNFVLKTSLPATVLERQIRQAVAAIDPDIMVAKIGDVPQMLEQLAGQSRIEAILVVFAIAGLLIAIIGVYGLMSQLTQQRQRELGIRMALGADYWRIMGLILGHSGRCLVLALVAGLAASFGVNVLLRHTMPGLPPLSLLTLIVIGVVLAGMGLLASYFPSHHAARQNPADVLRAE